MPKSGGILSPAPFLMIFVCASNALEYLSLLCEIIVYKRLGLGGRSERVPVAKQDTCRLLNYFSFESALWIWCSSVIWSFLNSYVLLFQMNKPHTPCHRYSEAELDLPRLLFSSLKKPYFKNVSSINVIYLCKNLYIIVSPVFTGMCLLLCFSTEQ